MFTNILNKYFLQQLYKYRHILRVTDIEFKNAFTKSTNTFWIGTNLCGPSIIICYNILLNNNINYNIINNIKIYNNCYGCNEYYQDHTFMIYNDNIYIDPTYKQFLVNPSKYPDNIFIGTRESLQKIIKEDSYLDDMNLWNKSKDITNSINSFILSNNLSF
jgi:hypothetical protein